MEIKIVIDDRIVKTARKLVSGKTVAIVAALSVAAPVVLYAGVPYFFKGGDPISAEAVNGNFTNLDGRVGVYEAVFSVDDKGNVGLGVQEPLADLNVQGNLSQPLTGTVGVVSGTTRLQGFGTLFTDELNVGDAILVGTEVFTVVSIANAEKLELDAPHTSGADHLLAYTDSDLFVVQDGADEPP